MAKSECNKWLDTLTDADLGEHSQVSLANEAWKRGAAHAAAKALEHIEFIDTPKVAVAGCPQEATAISAARVCLDRFIKVASDT